MIIVIIIIIIIIIISITIITITITTSVISSINIILSCFIYVLLASVINYLSSEKDSLGEMNGSLNVGTTLFGHQEDPDKLAQAMTHIEHKAVDVKINLEELLCMLDLQDKVPWPDMLDKFSTLASAMTQLQTVLRKSALPSGLEDYGKLLRKHLMVPHRLSIEIDNHLEHVTQNRVHCWSHDVAPDYLRTKPSPEVEDDEVKLDNEKNLRNFDQVNKQITTMNKHLEALLNSLSDNARNQAEQRTDIVTHNNQDTQKLVRSIVNGESLRPTRSTTTATASMNTTTTNTTGAAAAISSTNTNTTTIMNTTNATTTNVNANVNTATTANITGGGGGSAINITSNDPSNSNTQSTNIAPSPSTAQTMMSTSVSSSALAGGGGAAAAAGGSAGGGGGLMTNLQHQQQQQIIRTSQSSGNILSAQQQQHQQHMQRR